MEVVWTRSAIHDLVEIRSYIAGRDLAAAARVRDRIRHVVGILEENPLAGRAGRVAGTRELMVTRTPYIVAYRYRGERIDILRVLHGAQQWPEEL